MSLVGNIITSVRQSVRAINRKYAKPEIETTLLVKICLLTLRIYLLGMVGLMVYGLVIAARAGTNPADKTVEPAPATRPITQTSMAPVSAPAQPAPSAGPRS